ncbi:TrmB family transcriptional regulator [Archaeoglobus neptunius]|uniref:TrmB family transcriptional regulator n=1 Tax=Archaeoglobus neptunius TaxID=2798580 RepID=UPI0019270580|nr:TrmB family transcriptional regulator [Archaeoglobus neptunius]
MRNIIESLKKLGFTEYEARVYAALALRGEATASEIHKTSGVPRTKVYEVLKSLESKGFVETIKSSPASFRAIDPEIILEDYKEEILSTVNSVVEFLKDAKHEKFIQHPVWCVRGSSGVRNRAKELVVNSRDLIVITSRRDFVERIMDARGEETRIVIVTDDSTKFNGVEAEVMEIRRDFRAIFDETVIDGIKYRFEILLISDGYESFGVYRVGDEVIGVSIKLPLIILFQKMVFLGLLAGK